MSYTKQVLRGSIYFFIGSVLAAIFAYLTKLVLVRNLSVEDYGLFFAVLTFVLLFSVFSDLGLSQGLARFIADYNVKKRYGEIKSIISGVFAVQLIVAGVMVIIFWLLADFLAMNYFKDARAVSLLRLLAFYLPMSTIYVNFSAIFQGLKKSKIFSLAQPVLNVLLLIGVIIGLYLGMNIFAPVLGYLASFIFFFLIFSFPLLKSFNYFKYDHKDFRVVNRKLLFFSLPLMITTIGGLIITYFDTLMLTYFDNLASVGVYNIVYPTALLIVMLGTSLGSILLPILTELWSLKKKKEIIGALKIINKYLLILCLPIIIVLMIFSNELIRIFFGTPYLAGVIAFNILLVGSLFYIFQTINNYVLIACKKPEKIMHIYVFGAILNIVLNLFLIPRFGLNGAAIASVSSFFAMLFLSMFYVKQIINLRLPLKSWIITFFASLIIPLMSRLFIRFVNINIYVATLLGLFVGGIIYLFILYKLNIVNIKEIKKIIY